MSKTILIGGFGPGISNAVAHKFGAEGFQVALVARNEQRLAAGVKELEGKRVRAAAFPTDLSDPAAVTALVGKVRAALGPITIVHWNAYDGGAGDLLTADVAALRRVFDVPVVCLLAAVQAALPDLKKEKDAAVLAINGGLGYFDDAMDAAAVQWGSMGLGLANAAKHKLLRMLSQKLKGDGVYVGEAMVTGLVKGTAFDSGNGQATIEPSAVADKLWALYRARGAVTATI
ncbi:MAG TPA: SDR family NAD(P)-dependent oxidoreductase [Polyangia bacterium]|nr:SDR family NAD(P)-dependent oxidoreductase [Polyangia bacterium]